MFHIFNKTSEDMSNIKNDTIDISITDPPWNFGLQFGSKLDLRPDNQYYIFIENVFNEVYRVSKNDAIFIIICAKKIKKNSSEVDLEDLYTEVAKKVGFQLKNSSPVSFFETTNTNWEGLEENEKSKANWSYSGGRIMTLFKGNPSSPYLTNSSYENKKYAVIPSQNHPCPSNSEMIQDILSNVFSPGMSIMDPFMGTATLGVEVLKRKGIFYGFEIDKEFFKTAKSNLEQ